MQTILDFIHRYIREFFIIFIPFDLLRLLVCHLELKHTARLRSKKGKYHSVQKQYSEMGGWIFALPGFVAGVILSPQLWYAGVVLSVALYLLGYYLGRRKGLELDDIYRDVAWELRQEAAAEASREAAAHTLEGDADSLPEPEAAPAPDTEKEDTENG